MEIRKKTSWTETLDQLNFKNKEKGFTYIFENINKIDIKKLSSFLPIYCKRRGIKLGLRTIVNTVYIFKNE